VSRIKMVFIHTIKLLAGKNTFNLSPSLLTSISLFFVFLCCIICINLIYKENITFSMIIKYIDIKLYIIYYEVGIILKLIIWIYLYEFIFSIKSAGYYYYFINIYVGMEKIHHIIVRLALPWLCLCKKIIYNLFFSIYSLLNNKFYLKNKIYYLHKRISFNGFCFAINPRRTNRAFLNKVLLEDSRFFLWSWFWFYFKGAGPVIQRYFSIIKGSGKDILHIKKYEHLKIHNKPNSDEDFGYYLAGLIEGDGYIGKRSIEIAFHISDKSLAFFLKKKIGFGNVIKYSHTKNAVRYCLWNKEGIHKIFNLINGKFCSDNKINQIKKYKYLKDFNLKLLPSMLSRNHNDKLKQKDWILNNYWLCGFTDADGSFTIHLSNSKTHKLGKNLKLEYKISQKKDDILLVIKESFGGHIYYDSKGSVYRYRFASLKEQHKVLEYFDKFQLNSVKFIRYLKWRKCYKLYLERQHLTSSGIKKILNIIKNLSD